MYKSIKHITIDERQLTIDEAIDYTKDSFPQVSAFIGSFFNELDYITTQTSGSTGKPKTIQLNKTHVIASAKSTIEFLNLDKDTSALLCLPAQFIGGKMMLVRAFIGGYNIYLTSPAKNPLLDVNNDIHFLAATPYQLQEMLEKAPDKLSKINQLIIGGAPLSNSLKEKAKALPNKIYETFGMSETISHIALKEIKQVDEFNVLLPTTVAVNESNELIIHAPQLGVHQLQTNDIVRLTSENSFKWVGRSDFVINSGGIKIHPEQVEEKIKSLDKEHFNILITAIPHQTLGEQVVLCIENNSINTDALATLSPYEKPKKIITLPRFAYTKNGKINRKETTAILHQHLLIKTN